MHNVMTFTPEEEWACQRQTKRSREIISEAYSQARLGRVTTQLGLTKYTVDIGGDNLSDDVRNRIKPSYVYKETTTRGHNPLDVYWIKTPKLKSRDYSTVCTSLFYVGVSLVVAGLASMIHSSDVALF